MSEQFTSKTANIFALKDLPEVVKAALFSRYSRTDLGLRELYEAEFLFDPEHADEFFERVLAGFGDDSVAELGGAHLAMERISIIATKIIEDGRIGAAYLEKSTRYVDFGRKNSQGNYFFHQPKEIAQVSSEVEYLYQTTCTMLFDTYVELLPRVRARLREETEREPDISDTARERAIKAKAFDICRGLLPASTETNMGIFANGRFFETLLIKLMTHPLSEMQNIGQGSHTALSDVIPSLIKRANYDHPHYKAHDAFLNHLRHETKALFPHGFDTSGHEETLGAALVDFDRWGEAKVLAGILYDGWGRSSLIDLQKGTKRLHTTSIEEVFTRLAAGRENRRHKLSRGLEYADYTFEIIADYGVYRDLHRHRVLTHQRQPVGCVTSAGTDFGFMTPPELERPEWHMIKDEYTKAMGEARDAWKVLLNHVDIEVAQYVVPLAYNIRWVMKANLREWIWIVELRTQPAGHPNYRKICQQIYQEIIRVHPTFKPLFKFANMAGYDLGRSQAEQRQEEK